MIPRHVFIQAQLPLVEVVLAVAVPKPVETGCECNRPFNAFTLWDHHDVGVPQLNGQFSFLLHLSEELSKFCNSWIWEVA